MMTEKTLGRGTEDALPPSPLLKDGTVWTVLKLLSENKGSKIISKKLRLSTTTVKGHLRSLADKKLALFHNNKYIITKLGRDLLGGRGNLEGYEKGGVISAEWLHDRAHNIKVKCEVMRQPSSDWLNSWKIDKSLKNQVFYKQKKGDLLITFTGKNIVLQMPIMYAKDAELADAEAGNRAVLIMRDLEKEYDGLLLGNYKVSAQLITQHHAIPQEPMSKKAKEFGLSYMDEKMHIDASQTPELEFVHKETAHNDFTRYVDFVKDFSTKDTPKISELTLALNMMQKQLMTNQEQLGVLVVAQTTTQKQIMKLIPQEPKINQLIVNSRIDYCG